MTGLLFEEGFDRLSGTAAHYRRSRMSVGRTPRNVMTGRQLVVKSYIKKLRSNVSELAFVN